MTDNFYRGVRDFLAPASEDNVGASREWSEWLWKGHPCVVAHEDIVSLGQFAKMGKVFRYIPGDAAVLANDTVSGYCCDEFYVWWHFLEGYWLSYLEIMSYV